MIVADANLILHFVVDGDATAYAEQCYERDNDWVVPAVWQFEVINVLARRLRSAEPEQFMTYPETLVAFAWARRLVRDAELQASVDDVLQLARDLKLGGYDAYYVWLARRVGTRCVTADQQMLERASDDCISIEDFAAGR